MHYFGVLSPIYSKRHTHEECDSLHREIESMRTRIVKTEVDVCGQQADSKDVNRRLDRLDRVSLFLGREESDKL